MSDWRTLPGPLAAAALGRGPRVVLCHGFTQTGRSWRRIGAQLAIAGYEAVAVDLPGHGGSAHVRSDLRRGADLLVETTGPASYVGYSMGARMCLHAALMYPDAVARLALIGSDPGIHDDDERARRRAADDARARRMAEVGVEAFVVEWMAQPLFGTDLPDPAELADRSRNTVAGLQSSLRLAGTGAQVPLWPRLRELAMPVLVVAGERDQKFVGIGRRVAEQVAGATFATIADADHAAHLQHPDAVLALLLRWLGRPSG